MKCLRPLIRELLLLFLASWASLIACSQGNLSSSSLTQTPTGTLLKNTDSLLDLGGAATAQDSTVTTITPSGSTTPLWNIFSDPWGVSRATGHTTVTYSGNGVVTATVNYSSLNNAPVNGYPFIFYGSDVWGDSILGQPPRFPAQLSSMSSLVLDSVHSLAGSNLPANLDVTYDEWLGPTSSFTGGQSGAVEVMVMLYYKFTSTGCPLVATFNESVTLNGIPTQMTFNEYACNSGPGAYVMFAPPINITSGEVRINLLDFMIEGARESGVGPSWYLMGIDFGSEFGNASSASYSLTITKLGIEQTLK